MTNMVANISGASGKEGINSLKNIIDDDSKLGKYTCRFEILLENDKDF